MSREYDNQSLTSFDSTLVASHSQTLTNLQPCTTYRFRVRSNDEGGSIVVSSDSSFTTKNPADTTPPADVTTFTAIPSNSRVSLSWTNPTDVDFKGVMLRYRTDGAYPLPAKRMGFWPRTVLGSQAPRTISITLA